MVSISNVAKVLALRRIAGKLTPDMIGDLETIFDQMDPRTK